MTCCGACESQLGDLDEISGARLEGQVLDMAHMVGSRGNFKLFRHDLHRLPQLVLEVETRQVMCGLGSDVVG